MLMLKRFMMLCGFLFSVAAQAHPGHPALSIEHAHRAYQSELWFSLLLMTAFVAVVALSRALRRQRRERKSS